MTAHLPLASRHTRLRPLTPPFVDVLYELAVTNEIPWNWRVAAETPDAFRESLWHGVLVQFAIEDIRTDRPAGLISAYGANLMHGYAYVSMMLFPSYRMRAWPLESTLLFANYLFVKYNLENLYAETAGPEFEQFKSGVGTIFEVEGRFRNRVISNGERHDLYVLTFSRATWIEKGVPALERFAAPLKREVATEQVALG